jgi:hypothetical protein
MGEEDNKDIREFLGKIRGWQTQIGLFSNNNTSEFIEYDNFAIGRFIRPEFKAGYIDITNGRWDIISASTEGQFWKQQSGTNWASYAGELANLLRFGTNMLDGCSVDAHVVETKTSVTSGAASATLTCSANKAIKVISVTGKNDTRAPTWTAVYTPDGGTGAYLNDTNAAWVQGALCILVGGNANGANHAAVHGPIWMQASDELVITGANYVGGDTVLMEIVYEEYSV